jgi:hypothetical protein
MEKEASFFILLLNSALMGLYGIGLIFNPKLIITGLERYSSIIFTNQSSHLQKYIVMLIQLLGCFNIVTAISAIIAIVGYRKNWLLKYLLIIFFCNIITYGCSVAFDLAVGVIGIIEEIEIGVFLLSLGAFVVFSYDRNKKSKQQF